LIFIVKCLRVDELLPKLFKLLKINALFKK